MRVFRKDAGRWCKVKYEDVERCGLVAEGGQDKDSYGCTYRAAMVHIPGLPFLTIIDWPDIISLGPTVKAPKF